mmetsp:Transcript_150495/g.262989  ORF Transcript_150495/g.262989 Transcript_150495/m.262989 type:complete len:92 (-) Transcript_150495:311-586(-)
MMLNNGSPEHLCATLQNSILAAQSALGIGSGLQSALMDNHGQTLCRVCCPVDSTLKWRDNILLDTARGMECRSRMHLHAKNHGGCVAEQGE